MNKSEINFGMIFKLCVSSIKEYFICHFINAAIWLLISLAPLLTGFILKQLFDSLEYNELEMYFLDVFILFVVLIINVFMNFLGGLYDTKSRFYIGKFLRVNLFSYLISKEHRISSSEVLNIFNTDVDIIEEFISFCIDFINKIIYFIFAFYIMTTISVEMTFLVIFPLIVLTFVIYSFGNKIKQSYHSAKNEDIQGIDDFTNIIKGQQTYAFFSNKEKLLQSILMKFDARKKKNRKKEILFEIIEKMIEFFNYFSQIIIMISSIYFLPVKEGVGSFTLFIEYMSYGGIYLLIFQDIFVKYKSIQRFLDNLINKLDVNKEEQLHILEGKYDSPSINVNYPIKINNYSFSRNGERVNFSIEKGDVVFITGPTGGGKSRFINTLLGNSSDYFGDLEIGGKLLAKNQIAGIGYVPQTTMLFNDSLIHNITLYSEKVDNEKLAKSIRLSNLKDKTLIDLLESNNTIGINGKQLSEGQRQRIAIARGIYNCQDFMVLDNAFNNLDRNNKIEIFNNLIELGITLIIIISNDIELRNVINNYKVIYINGDIIRIENE